MEDEFSDKENLKKDSKQDPKKIQRRKRGENRKSKGDLEEKVEERRER